VKDVWGVFSSKESDVDILCDDGGGKSPIYRCPHCPYSNANAKLVHGHKVMHSAPQLKCAYCDHLNHYPSRMRRHMRRRHRGLAVSYVRLDTATTAQHSTATVDDDDDESTIQRSQYQQRSVSVS